MYVKRFVAWHAEDGSSSFRHHVKLLCKNSYKSSSLLGYFDCFLSDHTVGCCNIKFSSLSQIRREMLCKQCHYIYFGLFCVTAVVSMPPWFSQLFILRPSKMFMGNGVYSLKWRLTERYPKWGTLADSRPGRAAADQCKSSEFLQELRISGFPRFGVSPTCFRAK